MKCGFVVRDKGLIVFLSAVEKVKRVEHPVRVGWAALLHFCMCVVKAPWVAMRKEGGARFYLKL